MGISITCKTWSRKGWAQIRSQYASDEQSSREKLAHDLYYIKNASFFFDMEIVLSTLRSLNKEAGNEGLVTGGAGYIGSHTTLVLWKQALRSW